jgi:hypothetical protein
MNVEGKQEKDVSEAEKQVDRVTCMVGSPRSLVSEKHISKSVQQNTCINQGP